MNKRDRAASCEGSGALNKPSIGTTMYFVVEHFYYLDSYAGPLMEYCVSEATVTGFSNESVGEMRLVGKNPDGYTVPSYYLLKDIGKKVFFQKPEAAAYAEKLTTRYEAAWGWLGKPAIPMRRPWTII